MDVYDKRLEEIQIPELFKDKLTVIDAKIVFAGICDKCKKRELF